MVKQPYTKVCDAGIPRISTNCETPLVLPLSVSLPLFFGVKFPSLDTQNAGAGVSSRPNSL